MAESTLSISRDELAVEVAVFCGFGRGAAFNEPAWTARQQARIDQCLVSGIRKFYWPPTANGQTMHSWSFLRPITKLTLAAGNDQVDLPDDFGGAADGVTFAQQGSIRQIPFTNDARIREMYSRTGGTAGGAASDGEPRLCAIVPTRGTQADQGQRWQLFFYPLADQAYELEISYSILADRLTGAHPYVYGGAMHAEVVKLSCLAVAEQSIFDARGIHTMEFEKLLVGAIDADKKFRPASLGYNGDRSDERDRIYGRFRQNDGGLVSYGAFQGGGDV